MYASDEVANATRDFENSSLRRRLFGQPGQLTEREEERGEGEGEGGEWEEGEGERKERESQDFDGDVYHPSLV